MLLEKILVLLLALCLFGIAFRFLDTGASGVLKGSITLLLGILCVGAPKSAHNIRSFRRWLYGHWAVTISPR